MESGPNIVGFILLFVVVGCLNIAIDSLIVYIGIEWIGGWDLNFAQAVGLGVVLAAASSGSVINASA